jgi:hypothetical protein
VTRISLLASAGAALVKTAREAIEMRKTVKANMVSIW